MRSYLKNQNKTLFRPCLDAQETISTQPSPPRVLSTAVSHRRLLASCNFCGPKCLRQLYPGKDCPNEWVRLKLKRVPQYHMASHHSGLPEQGRSRQIFLEAHQGSQQMKAVFCFRNELSVAPPPHTRPKSQERGQGTHSLATHHAESLRAAATSRWEGGP